MISTWNNTHNMLFSQATLSWTKWALTLCYAELFAKQTDSMQIFLYYLE